MGPDANARSSAMTLVEVRDADEYFAAPAGKLLMRRKFFCSSPGGDLYSLFAWGKLDTSDTEELLDVLAAVERQGSPPRRQLVVLRHVEGVASAAMMRFIRYHSRVSRYLEGIAREAVVRPEGLVGVLSEGFYRVVPSRHEGRVFAAIGPALAWLSPTGPDPAAWLAAVLVQEQNALERAASGEGALTELLRRHGARLSIEDAARELGVSARTLQRRLRVWGTNFEARRAEVLVTLARQRLVETDEDIKCIALDLGFASSSSFIAMFRRATGASPQAWRITATRG